MKESTKEVLSHPVSQAEPFVENLFFNFRAFWLLFFLLLTVFFGFHASKIQPDASFEKMIPTSHPYIENFLENRDALSALGNTVRIIVETTEGDIFTADFQDTLKKVTDEVFYVDGVDRGNLQSLWTPNVRWSEVTEEGFRGGAVVPDSYDGSERSLELLRTNVLKSGQVGRIVANNFKSTIVLAPLVDIDAATGERLDYRRLSADLETLIRDKYQTDKIKIHIVGFAKVVGDLIEGASQVAVFFGIAFLITMVLLFIYSRCPFATAVPLICSTVAVIWQLGLLRTLGFGLDPYSMLVPFLVFAIGISHGVQMINNIAIACAGGSTSLEASRSAFRKLYLPGLVALVSDGIGFLTLRVIDIPVIKELALTASLGIAVLIVTNLLLLPMLMSYIGVTESGKRFYQSRRGKVQPLWKAVSAFADGGPAKVAIGVAVVLAIGGFYVSKDLKIGDLDPGAPELRPDSRYNLDNAFLTENYSTSTDVFVVMVQTEPQSCGAWEVVSAVDRFEALMKNVEGVQSVVSLVTIAKLVNSAMNEGNLKWAALSRNRFVLNNSLGNVQSPLINTDCSMASVLVFLDDHKAETLERVTAAAEAFAEKYNTDAVKFELAAGNSGVEASTNSVIAKAQYQMLMWVYAVVSLLCWLTFRSVKVVLCIILPLALTSLLGQALMAMIGIGVKVATLPVIALGVGIGVDYGIYIYSRLKGYLDRGMSLREGYYKTLRTTGTAVAFTGLTLAIGVGTWIFSPIKFQADMGLMLTFMFLWNMLGALVLLPALVRILVNPDKKLGQMRDGHPATA